MEMPLPVLRNFVAGSYVDPAESKTSPVVDPCTGETYAHAPVSTEPVEARTEEIAAECRNTGKPVAVWINTHLPFVSEMPHGGFGHSGHGKDLSMYGFEEYTRVKHVMSFLG